MWRIEDVLVEVQGKVGTYLRRMDVPIRNIYVVYVHVGRRLLLL